MAKAQWPLFRGRPIIEIGLTAIQGLPRVSRRLLADTGAASLHASFDLVLDEKDCMQYGVFSHFSSLGGAYRGRFPVYVLEVEVSQLGFSDAVQAVAVPSPLAGYDGIACFRFLNQFTYGNFGDATRFGLEL